MRDAPSVFQETKDSRNPTTRFPHSKSNLIYCLGSVDGEPQTNPHQAPFVDTQAPFVLSLSVIAKTKSCELAFLYERLQDICRRCRGTATQE